MRWLSRRRRDPLERKPTTVPLVAFDVPEVLLQDTIGPLHDAGEEGFECFALWLAKVTLDSVRIDRVEIPRQMSLHVSEGCHVQVEGDELFRVSVMAHSLGLTICAQVHTHPKKAYHSAVDSELPLVTLPGSLSLVIPNFAAPSVRLEEWAAYRFLGAGKWQQLGASDVVRIV